MLRLSLLIAPLCLALGGCGLFSSDDKSQGRGKVTVNWYCVSKAGTEEKVCQQRRMRNGKPVDDEIFDTLVIPADMPVEAAAQSHHRPPATAGNAVPWKRQPLAKVNSIDDPAALQVENLGPQPRQVSNTADIWERQQGGGKTTAKASADTGATAGKKPSPFSGYTLQMAAFSSAERCDDFVATYRARDLAVHQRTIASRGADWCIVTHGDFPSDSEAQARSRKLGEKYPQLSFWVRSWRSIKELEQSER